MNNEFIYEIESDREKTMESRALDYIDKYAPDQKEGFIKALKDIDSETKLRVSFVGQHNSGKSTIVSALTHKDIKISSNVETDVTTAYEWNDVIIYDTPGLKAGVKESHDEEALNALKESDIVVFCLTSSLFDNILLDDFINLAYKELYKSKMLLVVNKMSMESGNYDELKENYKISIKKVFEEAGALIEDFDISFIDAKDYLEGYEDEDDELIGLSHFNEFINALNAKIVSKNLLGKIDTKYRVMMDFFKNCLIEKSSADETNMITVYNQMLRTIERFKRSAYSQFESDNIGFMNKVKNESLKLVDRIGSDEIDENDFNALNSIVSELSEKHSDEVEGYLSDVQNQMNGEICEILGEDRTEIILDRSQNPDFTTSAEVLRDFTAIVKSYQEIAKGIRVAGDRVAGLALKSGSSFAKVSASSGSALHSTVLNVGHFFGKSFKPWEAVRAASNIGKVAKFIGPAAEAAGAVMEVVNYLQEQKKIVEIGKEREKISNLYSGYAQSIGSNFKEQFENIIKNLFDNKIDDINEKIANIINGQKLTEQKQIEAKDLYDAILTNINVLNTSESDSFE